MRRRSLLCVAVVGLLGVATPSLFAVADPSAAVDRLGLPGPYQMRGIEYRLAWSSQPTPQYAKHEYLPAGQTPERFQQMVLIEYAAGVEPAKAAAAKLKELVARKPADPTTNWAVARNPKSGELMIDFTLSDPNAPGGGVSEWNAYRYAVAPDGKSTVLLGMSRRAYGAADRLAFFQNLKKERSADLQAFSALPMVLVKPRSE